MPAGCGPGGRRLSGTPRVSRGQVRQVHDSETPGRDRRDVLAVTLRGTQESLVSVRRMRPNGPIDPSRHLGSQSRPAGFACLSAPGRGGGGRWWAAFSAASLMRTGLSLRRRRRPRAMRRGGEGIGNESAVGRSLSVGAGASSSRTSRVKCDSTFFMEASIC